MVFISVNLFSQTNMIIRKTDNSIWFAPTSDIDSVYYEVDLPNTVTDYDGNIYQTIIIGTQCWMAEDLKVIHYPNGDPIPNVTDNTAWVDLADNNYADAYCFYNNDNTTDYGAIYTYAAAIADNWQRDNSNDQGVCPDGWHLPTNAEWITLTDYLGGINIAGGKMKEVDTTHWNSPNTGATNESGFSALPGGFREESNGIFYNLGYYGIWGCATDFSSDQTYYRILDKDNVKAEDYGATKSCGFYVRCVKN